MYVPYIRSRYLRATNTTALLAKHLSLLYYNMSLFSLYRYGTWLCLSEYNLNKPGNDSDSRRRDHRFISITCPAPIIYW